MSWLKMFLVLLGCLTHAIMAQEMSLIGTMATQSETWGDLGPELAVDGDPLTYCVAASEGSADALAWWEVDLLQDHLVGRVAITASKDTTNARYLEDFDIWLFKADREVKLCMRFNLTESLTPGETRQFNCQPGRFPARHLRISRYGGTYRPDALAIAEVQIFAEPLTIVEEQPLFSDEIGGFEVPLQGLQIAQSTTWGDHTPQLAVDGNLATFSIACVLCDGSTRAGAGWWQVNFGRERNIVGVKLTSSSDHYNAQYLQDFIVALTSTNTTNLAQARICRDYSKTGEVAVSTVISAKCDRPTAGNFLIISRKTTSAFRPDAIAIAEVKVFEA